MKIEHVALNVPDPLAMGRWYVEHLGFTIKRRVMESPWVHFLTDDSGSVMIEIYGNPEVAVPDYAATDPLVLHLALVSADIEADAQRLTDAGASQVGGIQQTPAGDRLAMLRDPWGVALQLVQRAAPLID